MFLLLVGLISSTMEDDTKLYNSVNFIHPKHEETMNYSSLSYKRMAASLLWPMTDKESDRRNIQVEFDFSQAYNDQNSCQKVGQLVTWDTVTNYSCTEADLMTDEKKVALEKTIENLSNYVNRLLKVKHYDISLTKYKTDYTYIEPPVQKSAADLYVTILIRPYGSTVIATAFQIQRSYITGRNVQSFIVFDPKYIPTAAEDENSDERRFFLTTFHELMHALDLIASSIYFWTDKVNGKFAYVPTLEFTRSNYKSKTFYQICTPMAKRVISRRLGITKDADGNDICIEIEDMGPSITAKSHTKATLFRQDVMAGIISADSAISEITLALLDDMGWYTVNWSMAQPMTWGAKQLLTTQEADDYTKKPTYRYMPKFYISDTSHPLDLGHDYRSWGKPQPTFEYITSIDMYDIREYGDLYIPEDKVIGQNAPYDYVPLKNYDNVCRGNKFAYLAKDYSEGKCLETSVEPDQKLKLTISENNFAYCSTKDDIFLINGKEFMCNDPKTIGKIIDFLELPPYDYGHITLVGDRGIQAVAHAYKIWVVTLLLVLLAIVAILNVIFLLFTCTKCGRYFCEEHCPTCDSCCKCCTACLTEIDSDQIQRMGQTLV